MISTGNTRYNKEQRIRNRYLGLGGSVSGHKAPFARASRFFTLALLGMFLIMLLASLWIGVSVFKEGTLRQQQTNQERLALNSLQNRVRSADATGAFSAGKGPEGPSLVFSLPTDAGTFETRIYLHNNVLVQELAFDTDPYMPEIATTIVSTSMFSFSLEGSLLEMTTDQGTAYVALRSANPVKGGA